MALHRPTLFNLMNSIVGVSVLSFPYCFSQCGVLLGPLAMIMMAFFTKRSCSFLLVSSQLGRRRSFESLAQYTYGNTGKLAVEICIIGLMAGTLCAFNVIIGDLAPSLISNLFGIQQTPTLRAAVMIIMAFSVGLPLSLMRDISSLSSISAISLGFYATFVLHVFFGSLPHLLEGAWLKTVYFWRPAGFLQCLPIFSLAFACQTQLFGLYDSLPEPSVKKMENVVSVGIRAVACVYFSVGFFGYITFYDVGVKGDILTNYGKSSLAEVLKMGFVMSVIVSFPLMVFPMRASINSLLFPSQTAGTENMPGGPGYMPQNRFVLITVVVISVTLMVGIFTPQIEFVLGLTGATIGALICLVLPASMYLNAVQDTQGEQKIFAKVTIGFGLICLVASTYSVLSSSGHSHHESAHQPPSFIKPTFIVPTLPNISEHIGPVQTPKASVINADVVLKNKQMKTENPTREPDVRKTEKLIQGKRKIEEIRENAARRKEPALPHAPDEKAAELPIEKKEKGADPVNEKRQLMSADDTLDDKNLSSKLDVPQKSALKASTGATKQENEQRTRKSQEKKKPQVESYTKSLKDSNKPDSRERRHLEQEPGGEVTTSVEKNDGTEKGASVTPTSKAFSTPVSSSNDTNVHIMRPNSSFTPLKNPASLEKTPTEAFNVPNGANLTGEVLKGRELKSNDVIGRTLKSKDAPANKDGSKMLGRAVGYSNLWGKRLAKYRSLRANKPSKIGVS